jgi:hypothetical protein
MKVRLRADGLTSNMKIKRDKMIVVFTWLYEFKFSSTVMLAGLLGADEYYAWKFFRKLIEQEYITLFTNPLAPPTMRFLALTQKGVNFMIAENELDGEAKAYDFSRFKRIVTIFHHLEVQGYILKNINKYSEVVWEYNMKSEDVKPEEEAEKMKPDALVFLKSAKANIAIEYERWAKTKPRIFYNFYRHYENLVKGNYAGVMYVFEDEKDLKLYEEMFNLPEWKRYRITHKEAKPVLLSTTFKPRAVGGLDGAFIFTMK